MVAAAVLLDIVFEIETLGVVDTIIVVVAVVSGRIDNDAVVFFH